MVDGGDLFIVFVADRVFFVFLLFSFLFARSMDQGSNMIRQTDPHDNGMYHAQVYHRMGKQWYSIQDLSVQEVPHEIITKSEVLMLLYERKDVLN